MAAEATRISLGVGGYSIPEEYARYAEQSLGVMSLRFHRGNKGDAVARLPTGKIVLPMRGCSPSPRPGEAWTGEVLERSNYCLFRPVRRSDGRAAGELRPATEEGVVFSLVKAGEITVAFVRTRYGVAKITSPDGVSFAKIVEVIERFAQEHGVGVFGGARIERKGGYRAVVTDDVFVTLEEARMLVRGLGETRGGAVVTRPLEEVYQGIMECAVEEGFPADKKEAALQVAYAATARNYAGLLWVPAAKLQAREEDGWLDIADAKGEPLGFANQRAVWIRLDHPAVSERLRKRGAERGDQFCRMRLRRGGGK